MNNSLGTYKRAQNAREKVYFMIPGVKPFQYYNTVSFWVKWFNAHGIDLYPSYIRCNYVYHEKSFHKIGYFAYKFSESIERKLNSLKPGGFFCYKDRNGKSMCITVMYERLLLYMYLKQLIAIRLVNKVGKKKFYELCPTYKFYKLDKENNTYKWLIKENTAHGLLHL